MQTCQGVYSLPRGNRLSDTQVMLRAVPKSRGKQQPDFTSGQHVGILTSGTSSKGESKTTVSEDRQTDKVGKVLARLSSQVLSQHTEADMR